MTTPATVPGKPATRAIPATGVPGPRSRCDGYRGPLALPSSSCFASDRFSVAEAASIAE